ncbi:MAG: RHS repeat-associated core domain-containing protein, partial [Clostridium sp.]|nr:RHS repeat-associated core domain-containing protein [Clostridium sp.]
QISNRFRYAGEQYDPITGQYYLRARFYNPVVGRFTQEDTYRGDGLNLYSYVQNNPVKYIDPSGYCAEKSNSYAEASKMNRPYYDSVHNVLYEKVTDYLQSKTEIVAGDPLMYSVDNSNGGKVVVSIAEINSLSFINTLNHYNSNGQNITVLTGTHGCPEGGSALGINNPNSGFSKKILGHDRRLYYDRDFYVEDAATANAYNNITVVDVSTITKSEFEQIVNSKDVTICAWCFSERSLDLIDVIK